MDRNNIQGFGTCFYGLVYVLSIKRKKRLLIIINEVKMKIKLIIMMAVTIFALLAPVSVWAFSCPDMDVHCYRIGQTFKPDPTWGRTQTGTHIIYLGKTRLGRCFKTLYYWPLKSCQPCSSDAPSNIYSTRCGLKFSSLEFGIYPSITVRGYASKKDARFEHRNAWKATWFD